MNAPPVDDQPTPEQLDALYSALSNWGRWGADDELGALNFLTPERRAAAGALVRSGLTVSLAHDFPVNPSPETPSPAHHHMLASGDARDSNGIPGYEASRDYIGTEVHGMGITHLDALCHMFVRGEMYNGRPAGDVKSTGALSNTVMATADGLAGRGVFLDVPRARGVEALDGNTAITVADLERAEETQGSPVRSGDLLIVGGGRDARRAAQGGRFDPFRDGMAGLHPQCLPWLHEREVALLMGDGISDMTPGLGIANWPFPVHQIGITGMGLHLVDNVNLARLAPACAEQARWEFLCVVAPLRIPGGTGCPVNPVAIFVVRTAEQVGIGRPQAGKVRLPHLRQVVRAVHRLARDHLGLEDLCATGGDALEVVARTLLERQRLDGGVLERIGRHDRAVVLHEDHTLVAERVDDLEVRLHTVVEVRRLLLVEQHR